MGGKKDQNQNLQLRHPIYLLLFSLLFRPSCSLDLFVYPIKKIGKAGGKKHMKFQELLCDDDWALVSRQEETRGKDCFREESGLTSEDERGRKTIKYYWRSGFFFVVGETAPGISPLN